MKKAFMAIIAAAAVMAFSAVSCGKDKEEAPAAEADVSSVQDTATSSDDLFAEYTTTAEELEQLLADMRKKAMERVDITAQPIADYEIPGDWKEVSDGRMRFRVPPDVEDQTSSSGSIILGKFKNAEKDVAILTMNGNDWSKQEDSSEENDFFPEASDEKTTEAFEKLGMEYDGTRTSFYKAVLSFTSADRTDENAEAFDTAALAKGLCFIEFPEVFYKNSDGHDIYAHAYPMPDILLGGNEDKDDSGSFWVGAFADPNTEYTLSVHARSREEALMICSTITFVEEQG